MQRRVLLQRKTTLILSIDAGFFYFEGVALKSLRAVSDQPGLYILSLA